MDERPVTSRLTQREREVANLIGLGFTNRQIGLKLSISERTVGAHVQNILNKLGVNNRAQIATWSAVASRGAQGRGDGARTSETRTSLSKSEGAQPAGQPRRHREWLLGVIAVLAITVAATDDGVRPPLATTSTGRPASGSDLVVVPRGSPVQIAVVLPFTGGSAVAGGGAWNAVRLAIEKSPRIRGFSIQLNRLDGPCGADNGLNILAAQLVVANPQNVAVIGHFCSVNDISALPFYEAAGVVTVSGSVTNPSLPTFGPSVFNTVAISDACCPYQNNFDAWYATVSQLPADIAWRQQVYRQAFGALPPVYADLYYDAAALLVGKIAITASLDVNGNLVIDRTNLAQAVRTTTAFGGVTCTIALGRSGFRVDDPGSVRKCAGAG